MLAGSVQLHEVRFLPLELEPERQLSLLGVRSELLQFAEDVAVEEFEAQPVGVQGLSWSEADANEQGQEVVRRLRGAGWAQLEGRRERPDGHEWDDVGMRLGQAAEIGSQLTQGVAPVRRIGVDGELGEDDLDDAVDQGPLLAALVIQT